MTRVRAILSLILPVMSSETKQCSYRICASHHTPTHVASLDHSKWLTHICIFLHPPSHTPQLLYCPLAHSQDSCSNIGISTPRSEMWSDMNPFIATSNIRVRNNSSPSHTLQWSMWHPSNCPRPFILLSKVMAIRFSLAKSYILNSEQGPISPVLTPCKKLLLISLLYLWRVLIQQDMQKLRSHSLLLDSKLGWAFP